MTPQEIAAQLRIRAREYHRLCYFEEDPIRFPRHFYRLYRQNEASLQDVEIAGILTAHLAWGRRSMILRDCRRMMDEMEWQPYLYIQKGHYRDDPASLHRTVRWSDFARICGNLQAYYREHDTLEPLAPDELRVRIYGQKSSPQAANKKIHMFRRWMIRRDGPVDLGLWSGSDPAALTIPLDVHVHRSALELGITHRTAADARTAEEITRFLRGVFPGDPCLGDFALFAYGSARQKQAGGK